MVHEISMPSKKIHTARKTEPSQERGLGYGVEQVHMPSVREPVPVESKPHSNIVENDAGLDGVPVRLIYWDLLTW